MLQNMCQQISGAALSAFLPTFTRENGFEGANAQIATLAPYGAAIVVRIPSKAGRAQSLTFSS